MIICLGTTPALQKTMSFARLTIDGVNRALNVESYAAGKALNAARVLHALGREVLASGFVGGESGRSIEKDLESAGIEHDFIWVATETRTCVTMLDQSAGTATELIEEAGAVSAENYEALLGKLAERLDGAEGLVLAGTLPKFAPEDFYARCVALAAEAGVAVILDAKGKPLQLALAQKPMVVKPNRSELEGTFGFKMDSEEALKRGVRELSASGPRWVVVTAGAAGTVVSDGESFWRISTPRVKVVNPIGSGDSFGAGLMAGIAAGQSVPEACRLGAACGGANAMTELAGHVRLEDVETLLGQVAIAPL